MNDIESLVRNLYTVNPKLTPENHTLHTEKSTVQWKLFTALSQVDSMNSSIFGVAKVRPKLWNTGTTSYTWRLHECPLPEAAISSHIYWIRCLQQTDVVSRCITKQHLLKKRQCNTWLSWYNKEDARKKIL